MAASSSVRSVPESARRVTERPESLKLMTGGGPLPLGFARDGTSVFLVARDRGARWPVEALRRGTVELLLREGRFAGRPELVTDPLERERVLAIFLDKYGPERFREWYDHPARVIRVVPDDRSASPPTQQGRYYDWLTAEFDNVADDYDQHILGNRMNRLLRDRSLALLRSRFDGRPSLLEIGCGSGMETLPLLRLGHRVTVVDISERMLAVVRRKAGAEGLEGQLTTYRSPARELDSLLPQMAPGQFDGAYSTYGAMNCEPDLRPVARALRSLLKPGAPFITGVYNRWCLFEVAGYGLTLQFARAMGRRGNPIPVGASRFCVDVYAYAPQDIRRVFREGFRYVDTQGVPVVLPPSDLTSYAERFSRHFERLARWDAWVGARWPWSSLGDHFLMTFLRT